MGWKTFGRASSIFKSKMPISLKKQVYDLCILPTITGAKMWNLTKHLTLKLRTYQRVHERIMLGFTWKDHKTAHWIHEQTKLQDIIETIKKLKWNWVGHIARMNDNCWTQRLTLWTPCDREKKKKRKTENPLERRD